MFVVQIVHAYVEFICDTGISSVHHTWNMHALRVAIQVLRSAHRVTHVLHMQGTMYCTCTARAVR